MQGLERPRVFTGDALFAGSAGWADDTLGKAQENWTLALESVFKRVLSLPKDTIVCPGHGPMSSVGYERANNPFFGRM